MPYSNFCPACGEALPLLPDRWQERIWIKLTGCRCPACGYRLREGHWKSFGLGMGLGLVVGLGLTTRQAVQPAPPLHGSPPGICSWVEAQTGQKRFLKLLGQPFPVSAIAAVLRPKKVHLASGGSAAQRATVGNIGETDPEDS
jgi:DNA-directed RNA polymerase subunit RPC12/RpoP